MYIVFGNFGNVLFMLKIVPSCHCLLYFTSPLVSSWLMDTGIDSLISSFLLQDEAEPIFLHVPRLLLAWHQLNALNLLEWNMLGLFVLIQLFPIILQLQLFVDFILFNGSNVTIYRKEYVFGKLWRNSAFDDFSWNDFKVGIEDSFFLRGLSFGCCGKILLARIK